MNFFGLIRFFATLPLVLSFMLATDAVAPRAQPPQPMIEPHAQAMPLLPFLDFYVDESMSMDIEEVANLHQGWQPLALDRLPLAEGIVWLRFTIAPLAEDARPRTFLLDMGESVPGQPVLYDPVHNELSGASEWRENFPAQRNILLLPEADQEAIPCYIRVDGLPGPWFAPMIRTPQNAASNFSSLARTAGILALAVIMLLCILRGLGEKGQWRYWTALFVGVALTQAILGMPREAQHLSVVELTAVLCPGLALMFLPHVGRHLMQAKKWSRSIDIQLFLLSLPGAVLAVLPLVPGWNWLDRFLELWPLATLLFVPTALGAWMMGIPGSRRFLLACILPPIFVVFALLGMEFGLPANLLAACPIWSIALGALLLVAMRSPLQPANNTGNESQKVAPDPLSIGKKNHGLDLPDIDTEPARDIINLDMPLDDPNLRLLPPQRDEFADLDLEEEQLLPPEPAPEPNPAIMAMKADEARELALWKPVDDILRETAALEQCSLPPSARESLTSLKAAAKRLGLVLSGKKEAEETEEKTGPKRRPQLFNLQRILRSAHDSVAALAECSGIALSWYMPPHLTQTYSGDAHGLENALRLLLESSVRCSRHGAIKLCARVAPGSPDHGHLLFTISDDGKGYPPHERSSLALAKAWEFAGEHGGYLSVEASDEGAAIAFTAHFVPKDMEEDEEKKVPQIVLAGSDPGERRQLARIMEALPCRVAETESAAGALAVQSQTPSSLLVTQGRLARPASADMVRDFCRIARQNGLSECYVLAVTTLPETHWGLLKSSGFTHAMLEPVDPDVLRSTVAKLLNLQVETQEEDSFQPENVALAVEKANAGERAPTMLIDQDFSIRAAFEGPDWLGKPLDKNRRAPRTQESGANKSVSPAMPELAINADAQMPEPEPVPQRNSSEDMNNQVEWVGEPQPIEKTPPSTEAAASPEYNIDWDGKTGIPGSSVTDFIMGAEKRTQPEPAVVKDFMQESASLVSSTLSSLLSKKGETVVEETLKQQRPAPITVAETDQPARIPEKEEPVSPTPSMPQENVGQAKPVRQKAEAPSLSGHAARGSVAMRSSFDPEVLALLDRLDEQKQRASAFCKAGNCKGVAAMTAQMAQDAEAFGLRLLTRMASCVWRAADAGNLEAVNDLLPDLEHAVERNRILITQKQGDILSEQ